MPSIERIEIELPENHDAVRLPGPGVPRVHFEPEGDLEARGRAWRDHLAPIFTVDFRPETDLSAPIVMHSYHLGELIVGDVIAPANILERSAETIRRQGIDHILMQFYRRGQSVVEAGDRIGKVTPVHCIVFDLAQPVRIVADAVDATNVLIPRILLEQQGCRPETLHGRPLDHDGDPFGHLVHHFIANVVACGDLLGQREALSAASAITQLCATWLRGQEDGSASRNPDMRIRARRLIEAELCNPNLTPALIAARLGVSRSALYREFAPNGIVSYIRDRRLMQAMRRLIRDDGRPVRISRIAHTVGFSDERTFRRAFKQRFGFIPSDTASRIGTSQGLPFGPGGRDWIENL